MTNETTPEATEEPEPPTGPRISFQVRTLDGAIEMLELERFEDNGTIGMSVGGNVYVMPPDQADDVMRVISLLLSVDEQES